MSHSIDKCLLFDCDGTLVDSERLCNIGLVKQCRKFGVELDADELVMQFRGWKLARILKKLENEYDLALPQDFVKEYRQVVSELFEKELKPIENIEYALKNLAEPKAVVSSGPISKIEQALRLCGLSEYFGGHIYSSYEINIWKPNPGVFEYAAKDMGVSAKDCIVIDDGPVGIEAGYKAGMKTLFYNRFNESCAYDSTISFQSMLELPGLVHS